MLTASSLFMFILMRKCSSSSQWCYHHCIVFTEMNHNKTNREVDSLGAAGGSNSLLFTNENLFKHLVVEILAKLKTSSRKFHSIVRRILHRLKCGKTTKKNTK